MITPIENKIELAKILKVKSLLFKREDLHKYGSHKGRSIPVLIDFYISQGKNQFAISSSGNAALAAGLYIKELNKTILIKKELDIFVSNNIAENKLEKLKKLSDQNIRVLIKERPLQALTQAVQQGFTSLRQSTDDKALVGYESLAQELAQIKDIGAVFIGTSSGTTAQALAQYFLKNNLNIQVHIVQTSSCHPMVDQSELSSIPEEKSIADAIVDNVAYRKDKLLPLIHKTGGRAWCAINDYIITAHNFANKEISLNSALSIVGVMQANYTGHEIKGSIVCLITGE